MNSNSLITEKNLRPLLWLSIAAYIVIVIITAWISDDAYITLRTIDNFVNGYGLRWNIIERVQSYTHPLWMFALSGAYFVTREPFYTTIFVSIAVSAAALYFFVFRLGLDKRQALFGVLLLIFSRAFCDYSTSGLENPLTHLLLALFLMVYLRDEEFSGNRLFFLSLAASLGMTNRLDTVLLFLPPLAYAFYKERSQRNLKLVIIGMAPIFAWEIFSIIYYGFPFPNTAYAKLLNGIPPLDLAKQGLKYIKYSAITDTITVVAVLAGIILPIIKKQRNLLPFSLGVALYLVYTVKIGGDFMAGRFLASSYFISVAVIASCLQNADDRRYAVYLIMSSIIAVTMHVAFSFKFRQMVFSPVYVSGIADERTVYFSDYNLFTRDNKFPKAILVWEELGREWHNNHKSNHAIARSVGVLGYYSGPEKYIVDMFALSDPLLARLPSNYAAEGGSWRIGHFDRKIPDGYMETVVLEKNLLQDRALAAYYDRLSMLTRAGIFSAGRFTEIWRFNTKAYDKLVNKDYYANTPNIPQVRRTIVLHLYKPNAK